jgi:hypothetical protein
MKYSIIDSKKYKTSMRLYDINFTNILNLLIKRLIWLLEWRFLLDKNQWEFGGRIILFVQVLLIVQLFLELVLQSLNVLSLQLQLLLQLVDDIQFTLLNLV